MDLMYELVMALQHPIIVWKRGPIPASDCDISSSILQDAI
jgi:hypothetical protein